MTEHFTFIDQTVVILISIEPTNSLPPNTVQRIKLCIVKRDFNKNYLDTAKSPQWVYKKCQHTNFAENPHQKANINPSPEWAELHNINRLAWILIFLTLDDI